MPKKYTPIVLWSGGQDSTLILYNLCEKLNIPPKRANPKVRNDRRVNIIKTMSFNHDYMPNRVKMEREQKAREKLITILESKFEYIKIEHEVYDLNNINIHSGNSERGAQVGVWTLAAYYVEDYSELYVGYNQTDMREKDDKNEVKIFTKTIKQISFLLSNKKVKVKFPLIKSTRTEISDKLKSVKLLEYTTWCHSAEKDDCGTCLACLDRNNTTF